MGLRTSLERIGIYDLPVHELLWKIGSLSINFFDIETLAGKCINTKTYYKHIYLRAYTGESGHAETSDYRTR